MTRPRLFIGSSVEGLNIAYAVQQNLMHEAEITVWSQGVFDLSRTTIESLAAAVQENDFAIFVFSPDDLTRIRDQASLTVRDNVLFEFGLFVGRLGRERVYVLIPSVGELHLPTDLLGITHGRYETTRSDANMQAATGATCHQIAIQIRKLGFLPGRSPAKGTGEEVATDGSSKRSWIADYFDKKYDAAKQSLLDELAKQNGEDALATRACILLCDYQLAGKSDITPLISLSLDHPDSIRTQIVVANVLRLEGYVNKAMEVLAAARKRAPNDASLTQAIARVHGDAADNQSAIAELERIGPDQFPDVAIDLAEALEREGKPEDALRAIQRCYVNHPSHKGVRFKYARLAQDLGKHEVALALFMGLRDEDPESVDYWGYLGNSSLSLDLYDSAMTAYRRAEASLKEGQNSQWIVSNIGNLLNNKGFYTETCDYLERALKNEPMSEYAHDRMASALKKKAAEAKLLERARGEGKRQIREAEIKLLSAQQLSESVPSALSAINVAEQGLGHQST